MQILSASTLYDIAAAIDSATVTLAKGQTAYVGLLATAEVGAGWIDQSGHFVYIALSFAENLARFVRTVQGWMGNLVVLGWMAMGVVFAEETADMVQLPLAANTDY